MVEFALSLRTAFPWTATVLIGDKLTKINKVADFAVIFELAQSKVPRSTTMATLK
jgi:hypothetical protein